MAVAVLRDRARARVNALVHGGDLHLERYDRPAGDPGLFGPGSMVWRVHGDLPGMFTGGIAALLLQSLHPLAMAAVDRFSDYRERPIERLNRTAAFVTVTSFGSTPAAAAAVERVRRVHTAVRGEAPDGRAYTAADPALLTWVHVAEAYSFLRGYEVFGDTRVTPGDRDRYFREAAGVAERLGAVEVPRSAEEVRAYLRAIRPQLRATPAALDAVRFLRSFHPDPLSGAAIHLLMNGAVTLLPSWAARELRIVRPSAVSALLDRPAVRVLGAALRYACQPSAVVGAATARISAAGS